MLIHSRSRYPSTPPTASFIGPPNVLSLAYFACALAATPICIYAAWVSPRARRGLCIGLACLSAAFLLLQGSMVAVARVGGHVGRGAQALIELLAIEESGPVSFRLLGFITRDLAVLIAAVGALHLLRRTEEGPAWRRLTLSSPVRILPKASFLDCNWRMLTLGVLIVSRYAVGRLGSPWCLLSYHSNQFTNQPTLPNHKFAPHHITACCTHPCSPCPSTWPTSPRSRPGPSTPSPSPPPPPRSAG